MARIIRMPPLSELPKGAHRDFVEELRRYYRTAGRPPLRQISRAIEGRTDLKEVTASQETIRRMLRGMVLPTDWDRVYAVFRVLCELGNTDPDGVRWDGDTFTSPESNCEYLRRLWDDALEETPSPAAQPTAHGSGQGDPWDSPPGRYSDEPPF